MWTGFIWLTIWASAGCCEDVNEVFGSAKDVKVINQQSKYQLLKKDSAPCS
jgi:hypothetical protein